MSWKNAHGWTSASRDDDSPELGFWGRRHLRYHGTTTRRGMAKWGGQMQRAHEKPRGRGGPGKGRRGR
jgi:hypothetical protein